MLFHSKNMRLGNTSNKTDQVDTKRKIVLVDNYYWK